MKKSEARARKLKKLEAESLFSNLLSDSERKHLHSDEGAFDTSEEVPIFIQSSADDQLDYKDFLDSLSEEEYFDMGKNLGLNLETFDEFGNLIAYTSIFEGELKKDTKDENKSRETSNQNAMDVFDLIKSSLDKGEKIKTAFFKLQAVGFVPFAFIDNIGMNLKSGNHLLKPFMNKNNENKV